MNSPAWETVSKYLALLYRYKIVEVLQNPQSHRRELLFLLGIFFIILTIVVCLLLLIYFQLRLPPTPKPVTKGEKAKRRRGRYLKAAVPLLFLVFVLSFAGYSSTRSETCARCHVLDKDIASWKRSIHKKVPCAQCHFKKGATGFLVTDIEGLNNAYLYLNEKTTLPMRTSVPNSSCLPCHQNLATQSITGKGIRMSHKEVLAAGYACTDCHAKTTHKDERPARFTGMKACLPCHDGKTAPVFCNRCHVNDPGHILRQLEDFPKVFIGEASFKNCGGCHKDQRKCIDCHGLRLPHPDGWAEPVSNDPLEMDAPEARQLHAKAGAFGGKRLCEKCHNVKEFCNNCHGFPGHGQDIYGSGWSKDHDGNEEACRQCHSRIENFCRLCHAGR